MTRNRVLAAATIALLAAPVAAQAAGPRATVRAETTGKTVLAGGEPVGSARAYLDTAGTPHALPANTVLGQLVTGAAAAGADLGVSFDAQFGGFVASIGGQAAPASGFWQLYVDNVSSQTGAEATVLKKGQEIVWILDPDFNKPGPTFLDLDLVSEAKIPGTAMLNFRVTVAGGAKAKAAKGAQVIVNGKKLPVPASGRVTAELKPGTAWTARATLAATIHSELLTGTS